MKTLVLTLIFGAVLAAPLAIYWWRQNKPWKGVGPKIDVVMSRPLGQRRSLALVEVEGKRLLLGITDHTIRLLVDIETPPGFESTLHEVQFDDEQEDSAA